MTTKCSNQSSSVTFLMIQDGQVSISQEGQIRLGRGMSPVTKYELSKQCVQLLNEGFPFEAVKTTIEKDGQRIEASIEAINRVVPGRASGWHFLAKCLSECKAGRRTSANLHRLIDRMIEEIDEDARELGLRFYAYPGLQEDLSKRIWDIFRFECPNRYATYKWSCHIVELKCYLAWKLAGQRTGFPIMPGESKPVTKNRLLEPLEHLFACWS
ncbi:MAG: hypothetical protein KHX35_05790 [Sutterella wadsworthensis]|nr:hypothetical protein [Sutterella wadsworthensis]